MAWKNNGSKLYNQTEFSWQRLEEGHVKLDVIKAHLAIHAKWDSGVSLELRKDFPWLALLAL